MRPAGIVLRGITGTATAIALLGGIGAWSSHGTRPSRQTVGNDPGSVRQGRILAALKPAEGNSLIAFSSGCFWGAEQAFRKVPGVAATAVGYTGGSSSFPSYELAHKTGHLETVLVEFDPRRTRLEELLKVFWTLPRSKNPDVASSPKPSYQSTIWTYDSDESRLAEMSRKALEKTLHYRLAAKVRSARPFYLAEEYHQQYDEKSGKELCRVTPLADPFGTAVDSASAPLIHKRGF